MPEIGSNSRDGDAARLVIRFEDLKRQDVSIVGGKNASIGEMIGTLEEEGIAVPKGFATTSRAYWQYVNENGMQERMASLIAEWQSGKASLADTGHDVRDLFLRGTWPTNIANEITNFYRDMETKTGIKNLSVAVRSSATAEDLPEASFAGQQESYLNISGVDALLDACKRCYSSLFTDRAIGYRQGKGFDHLRIALSIGIQRMVRSDLSGSGIMFSIDTESGFDKTVLINAAWGLGENVVQGAVNPDEYRVFKPLLNDTNLVPIIGKKRGDKSMKMVYDNEGDEPTRNVPTSRAEQTAFTLEDREILQLSRWGCAVEKHYGTPMDIEWAKDGLTNELFIVQARAETVQSHRDTAMFKTYEVSKKGRLLASGLSIGDAAISGRLCLIENKQNLDKFVPGSILVAKATDPDWGPLMKLAAAIINDCASHPGGS